MASRDDPRRGWRSDPEAAAASGGHLPPDPQATGPLFDPMIEPLAPEREETPRSTPRTTAATPRRSPAVRTRQTSRRRVALRRVKRTLKHVDPLSVLKLSLFFYACFLVLWLLFVAFLYAILASTGIFDAIENFGKGLVLWDDVDITLGLVEKWAFLFGLTFLVVGSLVNVLVAFLYNVGADVVGGVEMTYVERDV